MQRKVDTDDFRSLQEAKRLIDEAFRGGTAWYPDEQAELHGASSALARVIAELRREAPARAAARRLAAAADAEGAGSPPPDWGEPSAASRRRRLRRITDWGRVDEGLRALEGRERIPEQIRGITDWEKVDRALRRREEARAGGGGRAAARRQRQIRVPAQPWLADRSQIFFQCECGMKFRRQVPPGGEVDVECPACGARLSVFRPDRMAAAGGA